MVKKNSCVFISGAGTNLKALIHSSRIYNFPINIKLIVSSKKNALGLVLAKKFSIPYKVINTNDRFFEKKILIEINKKNIFNMPCWFHENFIKKIYKNLQRQNH